MSEELETRVEDLEAFARDEAVVLVALFDILASTHQTSEEAIAAYNRIAQAVGHEAPNNIFFDQAKPESE